MGAYGASASNAGGPVAKIFAGPGERGSRLLRRRKGFKRFFVKSALYAKVLCSGTVLAAPPRCKGFKGMQLQNLEHIVGRKGF